MSEPTGPAGTGQGSTGGWRASLASYRAGPDTDHAAVVDTADDPVEDTLSTDTLADETATDESGDDAETPVEEMAAEDEAPAEGRRRSWLPVALAVIFGLLAVVMLVFMTQLRDQRNEAREALNGLSGDRSEVSAVAGQFGEAILSYDYTDIEGSQQQVLDLSTGQFQREYETGFEGFAELIEQTEARSVATVTAVFVGDVGDERAEAIAVVDASVTGTGGTRTVADSYIRLDLVKVGETWKVDGVTSLNFASAGSDAAVPGASTTTTVPDSSE